LLSAESSNHDPVEQRPELFGRDTTAETRSTAVRWRRERGEFARGAYERMKGR